MAKKAAQPSVKHTKPASGSDSFDQYLPWIAPGLALLLFATGLGNGMVSMDDHSATIDNPAVTRFEWFDHFNLGMYAPVTWIVYSVAYAMGKDSAFWYHLFSALIHAVNAWLVFRVLDRMGLSRMVAFTATLFFAIHPLQVESVAWIAALSTPLFGLFSLLGIDYYIRYSKEETAGMGQNYWISVGLFLLACLSKSAAVAFPLALLVVDFYLKKPFSFKSLLNKAPFFAIAAGFGALTIYSRQHAGFTDTPADFSLVDRFLMVCQTVLFYWAKLLFPVGLSTWYPFIKTGGSWPWTYYAAPVALVAVLFGAWRMREKAPFIWWGVLFYMVYIVLALPYATFGTFELRSDRYNYLAMIGVFVLLASLPGYLKERQSGMAGTASMALVVLGLFWLGGSFMRIRDWKDTITLINKNIESNGDYFGRAYLWRGMEWGDKGKANPAMQDFNKAIEINPDLVDAYKYRGAFYGMAKQYEKSVADLTKYLEKYPQDAEYHYNRGLSLLNLNRLEDAIRDFDKTLEINPEFERAYVARGNAYKTLGNMEKANADFSTYETKTGQPAQQ